MKLILVAGARPNFMKIAPIIRVLSRTSAELESKSSTNPIEWKLVHTGQHYDNAMSNAFFEDLCIPAPHYFLNGGSGTHAEQTAKIMVEFEKVCMHERPEIVVVVGDVNSTLACAITAKKLQARVAHIEAGLRSLDMAMPEEINRIVTDSISDFLFVTEFSGVLNLSKEGKPTHSIFYVGHVMVDNLFYMLSELEQTDPSVFPSSGLKRRFGNYIFLTLHRPSNVDNEETFRGIVNTLNEISRDSPILFPAHPRTQNQLKSLRLPLSDRIIVMPPLPFRESLFLWKDASLVMTDSGGLQEETTALGVPCFTLRENTERPITVELGTNIVVGNKREGILQAYADFKNGFRKKGTVPELWDGHAADRIVEILVRAEKQAQSPTPSR